MLTHFQPSLSLSSGVTSFSASLLFPDAAAAHPVSGAGAQAKSVVLVVLLLDVVVVLLVDVEVDVEVDVDVVVVVDVVVITTWRTTLVALMVFWKVLPFGIPVPFTVVKSPLREPHVMMVNVS